MRIQAIFAASLTMSLLAMGQMGNGSGRGAPHGLGIRPGKVVTGAPYSAEVNSTSVRTLPDGNSIQRTTTGHVARDAQGRTYSQETITGLWGQTGSKTMTFISDPVAGFAYTLNAEAKTATRRALHVRADGSKEGWKPSRPVNPNTQTVELGIQLMNGVNAEGKKVTHTVPAGEMGNAQPIVATSESWYSPDLQVVVSSKRIDPREGTSTFTLNNIERSEPAATLFQVPSDYTIKDVERHGRGSY